ncbi:Aldo/keto reductase [Thozetella sp. PMI_491]|nr:Aldo/keto reductase [Thozetella sp. PMI_491]
MAPPFPFPDAPESPLYRHRQLAPTANVRVSPLCLGTMGFGEVDKARMGECTKETAFEILDNFWSLGGNFLDTACGYQSQQSEKWLGEWFSARGNRDEFVIATKYSSAYRLHEKHIKIQSNFGGNGTKSLRLTIENSLRNLRTTYIDLFYVHWWDYNTTIPELMHALNDLVTAGKVNYLGISDCPSWVVAKANQYARDHGLRQFVAYQGLWNAAVRDFERDIIPMCKDEKMAIIPFGAVGAGRFQTQRAFQDRENDNPGRRGQASEKYKLVSQKFEEIGAKKNASLHSIALAYVMQKAPYVFPLVGTRTLKHLTDAIEALKVNLTADDIEDIEKANIFEPGFPHSFLSGSQFGGDPICPEGGQDVWLTNILGTFDYVQSPAPVKPGN